MFTFLKWACDFTRYYHDPKPMQGSFQKWIIRNDNNIRDIKH